MKRSLLCLAAAALFGGTAFAQVARIIPGHFQPGFPFSSHGESVAFIDNPGNAADYYVVGAPGAPIGGSVTRYAAASGIPVYTVNGGPLIQWCGGPGLVGHIMGHDVADAGDFDGDGFRDFIVSSPLSPQVVGPCGNPNFGRIWIYSGAPGPAALLYTQLGTAANEFFGAAVTGVGDYNNDGFDDVAVGSSAGRVTLILGPGGVNLWTQTGGTGLGTSLAPVGDVDLDGLPDFLAGDPFSDQVRLYFGGPALPGFFPRQGTLGDNFGSSVSGLGEIDGDPFPEFAIGASAAAGGAGTVEVFDFISFIVGAPGQLAYTGTGAFDALGTTLAGGGDHDGDGTPDLLMGAATTPGYVRVASGASGAVLYDVTGTAPSFRLDAAAGSDVFADGFDEILVGNSSGDNAALYYGGPAASVTNIGTPCAVVGPPPTLAVVDATGAPGLPVIGGAPVFLQATGQGGATGFLIAGGADFVGTPFLGGPCLLHLLPPFVTIAIFIVPVGAPYTSPPIAVPIDPTLLGVSIAFQTFIDPGVTTGVTNGVNLNVGW